MLTVDCHTSPASYYEYQMPVDRNNARPITSSSTIVSGGILLKHRVEDATGFSQREYISMFLDDVLVNIKLDNTKRPEDAGTVNTTAAQSILFIDQLNKIKARFALSITQMAELFGVTRKSVYDWYEGTEPRNSITERMEVLIDVLDTLSPETNLHRLKIVWNIPVSGESFISVFNDSNIKTTTFRKVLEKKLLELSPRMTTKKTLLREPTVQLGEAHLAEFDRRADFIS